MKHLVAVAFILFGVNAFGQDTISSYRKDSIPQFPGGELKLPRFLTRNIRYPAYALEHRIEGTVYMSFIIEEDGTLTNIEVLKSPHTVLSEEALRIVKLMPKWEPATQGGKPVKFKYRLPINFKLK